MSAFALTDKAKEDNVASKHSVPEEDAESKSPSPSIDRKEPIMIPLKAR